ncbi:hypothetical protein RJ639_008092, partial [Escallonia herrerae]
DGTGLQFKSVKIGKYLCAELGGGTIIVANRTSASGWETFKVWRINATSFQFRVFNKQFAGLDAAGNGIDVVAVSNAPGSGTFEIIRKPDDLSRVRIKAPNGFFLQAKSEVLVTADSKGDGAWGEDDPSVFEMTFSGGLPGEFQVTNGYGPETAPQTMKEHWRTYIVEEDFKFIASNGLNAVRIPVGWWIASDPTPPKPHVGGSLQALDNGFLWAQYAKSPSLYAVELLNEPRSPGATLESVIKYYRDGYNAVRKHSSTAYVVMSNRLGPMDPKALFPLACGLQGTVIDVHYYNLFWPEVFDSMTVQQNINFINTDRSAQLNEVTTANGPVGDTGLPAALSSSDKDLALCKYSEMDKSFFFNSWEWVAEWQVKDVTKEDYQRFARAQLKLWGLATFWWAYWSLRNVNNHWSLEWMIKKMVTSVFR